MCRQTFECCYFGANCILEVPKVGRAKRGVCNFIDNRIIVELQKVGRAERGGRAMRGGCDLIGYRTMLVTKPFTIASGRRVLYIYSEEMQKMV